MKTRSVIISIIGTILFFSCSSGNKKFSEEEWKRIVESTDRNSLYADHRDGKKYYNPWMSKLGNRSFFDMIKWQFSSPADYTEYEKEYLPKIIPNTRDRIESIKDKDFILWIGHNTFLVRINNEYWLTDPIFSDRAMLPKRRTPPGISIDDLKQITQKINIIISHNHYDHLDKKSILNLPKDTKYYVPMGLRKYIMDWGCEHVIEMDWWDTLETGNQSTLVCLPAQHWSRRIGQSTNESLWASFLLISGSVTVYFGGDSGYFIGYKEIGRKYPGIDYAFIPTTAYHPRWFMHQSHMNIEETINAFNDLGAQFFIPTQWGHVPSR